MIEIIILNHLEKRLDCPVVLSLEDGFKESRFVRFERVGSSKTNLVNRVSFAFQSYGSSLLEAAELNEELKSAISEISTLDEIGSVKLVSDYNFTDNSTKKYRYQAIYEIYF